MRIVADPWLYIIGIAEDGLEGLSQSSRNALAAAEVVFGGTRHLGLAGICDQGRPWPSPFDISPVLSCRGKRTVVLVSGDPFWHGAGSVIAAQVPRGEWRAQPAPSTFSLAAASLGWPLEDTLCLGLHAAPFERLVAVLHERARIICLVRDGEAALHLARWLTQQGWGPSEFTTLSALGGPRECIETHLAAHFSGPPPPTPVAVAIEARGGTGLPRASGLPDELFLHDGQITKRPIRALALSALAPQPGQRLWDIGSGSGSISVEWALAGGVATAFEQRSDRAANIRTNRERLGVAHRIEVIEAQAPEALANCKAPDAIFVGGGLSEELIESIRRISRGAIRLVAHAVTLETEALLFELHRRHGGDLMRADIAQAVPLGRLRSWKSSRPIVQWSGLL
jgi:precorrin-6Y C5,15-methyltransferase (decarboxylating)